MQTLKVDTMLDKKCFIVLRTLLERSVLSSKLEKCSKRSNFHFF